MSTTNVHLARILDLPTKFFVDIGASDDTNESQTETLIAHGWSGLMFECNPVKYAGLSRRMASRPVVVIPEKVTPDNIIGHLRAAGVPDDFFLSLDIDGYDYFVLERILQEYTPALIVSEINEKIPPPMKFTVLYRPEYWWNGSHFYGYSVSMLDDLLPKFGYKIDEVHYNNVVLSPGIQTRTTHELYTEGYFARPDGGKRFTYNEDFNPIYGVSYDKQVEFLHRKFSAYEGRYSVDGSVHVENTGQIQLSQPFGQWIAKYAADTRFQRYLEIGTWNGRGSTCCVYDGFAQRSDGPTLDSYEIHPGRVAEAREIWKSVPSIRIHHGRVLADNQCPIYREVLKAFPNVTESWHTEDVRNFWSCRHVPIQDPEVVLLDGAEYLTQFEFDRVFKNCPSVRVYMLDDTKTEKTPHINAYLLGHPEWTRVAFSDTERNGWAVFERVTPSSEETPENLVDPDL